MKNERGYTLIELLATLALMAILITIVMSVFINGLNASKRTATNQQLQQEANFITESIRREYLKLPEQTIDSKISLNVINNTLLMNGSKLSEGYTYEITPNTIDLNKETVFFYMKIVKNDESYIVETTFSKLK